MMNDIYAVVAKTSDAAHRLRSDLFDPSREFAFASVASWWRAPCGSAAIADACVSAGGASSTTDARSGPRAAEESLDGHALAGRTRAGPFAAVHWVWAEQVLIAVRDIFGQAPLYYVDLGEFFALSTALASLSSPSDAPTEVDREAAFHYLAFGLPGLGRTLARNIRKVPAAHLVRFQTNRVPLTSRYFTPLSPSVAPPETQQASERIATSLQRGEEHLRASPPAALLLSGGIDSAYLAATYRGLEIAGYTIDFPEAHIPSEAEAAAETAAHFGLDHTAVPLDTATALVRLQEVLAQPEPCSAWSSIVHAHLVDRVTQDGRGVVVSGLGADEMFGSYNPFIDYYRIFRRFVQLQGSASSAEGLRALLQTSQAEGMLFPGIPTFFDQAHLESALQEPFNAWRRSSLVPHFYLESLSMKPGAHYFELMTAYECQNRIPDLLLTGFGQLDRAHGVESFYPFLAPDLVKQACLLTPAQKLELVDGKWKGKKIFRALARQVLPSFIFERKVKAYNAPVFAWLRDKLFFSQVHDRLMDSRLWRLGLLRSELRDRLHAEISEAVESTSEPDVTGLFRFWAVLTLGAWCDRWNAV